MKTGNGDGGSVEVSDRIPPGQPMKDGERAETGADKMLQAAIRRVDQALQNSQLDAETQRRYRQSVVFILGSLTPTAIQRHCKNAVEIRFYASHRELTTAFLLKYPLAKTRIKGVIKGVFDRDGVLHLNGDGGLFGREATLLEFHAHEIVHSIDGNGHEISDTEEWTAAWKCEKDKGLFSENGRKNAREGFAEFGQLILGAVLTRARMRRMMPQCLEVWEDNEL